jgi:Cu/Zn superoxide dismutase
MNNNTINTIKKSFIAVIAAAGLGVALLPALAPVSAQTMQTVANVETVLNFAALNAVAAPTQGTIAIIKKTDGSTVLRLQNLKTEVGPDLHVYLYSAAIPAKDAKPAAVKAAKYLDLGKLPAPFSGFYEYKVPTGTDLASFKSAIIWCDLAGVTFAGATLK